MQSRKAWNKIVRQTKGVMTHHRLVRRGLGSLSAVICNLEGSSAWDSEPGFSREDSPWGASQPGLYAGGSLPESERARPGTTPASSCLSALTRELEFLLVEASALLEGDVNEKLFNVGR